MKYREERKQLQAAWSSWIMRRQEGTEQLDDCRRGLQPGLWRTRETSSNTLRTEASSQHGPIQMETQERTKTCWYSRESMDPLKTGQVMNNT